MTRPRTLPRRAVLGGAAGLLLAGCGTAQQEQRQIAQQGWQYTDEIGTEVSLDAPPKRVAGLTDAVAALWNFGITPVAAFGYLPMAKDVQFEGNDTSEVAEAGSTYGEISIEKLAAAKPDRIVTTTYARDSKKLLYGFKDAAQLARVRQIAPVVAVPMVDQADAVIGRFAKLAHALGVDLEGTHVRQTRQSFTAASDRLTAAGERGLKVLCVAGYDAEVYLAKPADDPQLSFFQRLGVDFAQPSGTEYYWETLSWEQIGKYPVDLILYSVRAMPPEGLRKIATFASLPAVRAGQLRPWKFASMDYVDQAKAMSLLAGWLNGARKVA